MNPPTPDSDVSPDESRRKSADERRMTQLRQRYLGRSGRGSMSLAGAGAELAGLVVLLTLGGWWLDGRLGTRPGMMIAGLVVGAIGGIYNMWRRGKRYFKDGHS